MTQNDVEPITTIDEFTTQLQNWYNEDHQGFATMYDAAVANVKPLPPDTDPNVYYNWENRTINDLCKFFKDWYDWVPEPNTGLYYIQKFSWLNYENDYGMVFVTSGPGRDMLADFTNLGGQYMNSPESLEVVKKWITELGGAKKLNEEYVIPDPTRPDGGFLNFNDFFTREVQPGKRPIDPGDDSLVVAPADCVINMIVDDLTDTTPIPVKTVTMNIRQLLNNSGYGYKFIGGTAVSCILMPDTYHWYHAPVAGTVVESHDDIGGVYYGMRDFPDLLNKGNVGYGYDYSMFDDFRRGYLIIDTKNEAKNEDYGLVGMVPVGLNSIASVQFEPVFKGIPSQTNPPVPVEKGDKIGCFKYGGSLNILLFEPGRFPALRLLQGQRIGHFEKIDGQLGFFSGSWRAPFSRRRFFLG